MSYFDPKMNQGVYTLSNYVVMVSESIVPAINTIFTIGTITQDIGSFIPTEAFIYCDNGPTSSVASTLTITFNIGFSFGNDYNEWVLAGTFGGNGSSAQQALNFVRHKFKQLNLVATSANGSGYANGTPRNQSYTPRIKITGLTGTRANGETIKVIVGGILTGLK